MANEQAIPLHHPVSALELTKFLWASIRALLPTLAFDIAGTMIVFFALSHFYGATSIWPILGASLVPALSNLYNFRRRHSFDAVGLIVLIGLLIGLIPAIFGGSQRLLLMRESFVTGFLGVILLASGFLMRRPLAYFVIREFLTANEALPHERWDVLWQSGYFRHTIRGITIGWGALLLGEFVLRAFMALRMNIAFVLGAAPVFITILLLLAGVVTAFWLAHAMRVALSA